MSQYRMDSVRQKGGRGRCSREAKPKRASKLMTKMEAKVSRQEPKRTCTKNLLK